MELLKRMFPTILDMKNAKKNNQNSTKNRMTDLNISVPVKHRRDSKTMWCPRRLVRLNLKRLSQINLDFVPTSNC